MFSPELSVTSRPVIANVFAMANASKAAAAGGPYPNRVRFARKGRGLTIRQLADRLNMAHQTLSKLERGETELGSERMRALSRALGVPAIELLIDSGPATVPVVARVGAGAQVYWLDAYHRGHRSLRRVECPRGLDADDTAAAEIIGDSMFPIAEGWLIFFSPRAQGIADDAIGNMCVVRIPDPQTDGIYLVKHLRKGSTPGRFTLFANNAPPLEDVEIDMATPVRALIEPGLARYVEDTEAA